MTVVTPVMTRSGFNRVIRDSSRLVQIRYRYVRDFLSCPCRHTCNPFLDITKAYVGFENGDSHDDCYLPVRDVLDSKKCSYFPTSPPLEPVIPDSDQSLGCSGCCCRRLVCRRANGLGRPCAFTILGASTASECPDSDDDQEIPAFHTYLTSPTTKVLSLTDFRSPLCVGQTLGPSTLHRFAWYF